MRRFLIGAVAAAALALPAAAVADSCANVSRAAPECAPSCTGPVIEGNWVWLPSIGVPFPAWGFASPGGEDSVDFGFPGANGNYTNAQTSSLLGVSAICKGGGNAQNARQGTNGIQTGCE
jgi:opacity protein-like surface antigen